MTTAEILVRATIHAAGQTATTLPYAAIVAALVWAGLRRVL